jgi:hypothetical protein
MPKMSDSQRDRSRSPDAKARDLSRRGQRAARDTMRFLCIAFPPDLAAFQGSAAR